MDILAKAQELIDDGKPGRAAKLLIPEYKANRLNRELNQVLIAALLELEQADKAKSIITHTIKQQPEEADNWADLCDFYFYQSDALSALKIVNKALQSHPKNHQLQLRKISALADLNYLSKMHEWVDQCIEATPEHTKALLQERAMIYKNSAFSPSDNEPQVQDAMGMSYAIEPLNLAVKDLTTLIKATPDDGKLYLQRAHVYKQLQYFDEAQADFNHAIEHLSDAHPEQIEFIQQEIEYCATGGQSERDALAKMIREEMNPVSVDSAISLEQHNENNFIEAAAAQIESGGNWFDLLEEIGDDPLKHTALTIAQDILKVGNEPEYDYRPTQSEYYTSAEQKFCNRVEQLMVNEGFECLGDFEPKGLTAQLGRAVMVRFFLAADKKTYAICYKLIPLRPPFLTWFILWITGKWKKPEVIEVYSVQENGVIWLTNNTGDNNPFSAQPPQIQLQALPSKTTPEQVLAEHQQQITQAGAANFTEIENAEAIFEIHDKMRQYKQQYRQSIDFVTDDELQNLLQNQFDTLAPLIRRYIRLLVSDSAT
ncbi:MAG: hypothetical protein HWE13_07810 [Gammaproteobacteria bacterium]|nr:hypothetical protein [Gammaproteobacteria bacterium]